MEKPGKVATLYVLEPQQVCADTLIETIESVLVKLKAGEYVAGAIIAVERGGDVAAQYSLHNTASIVMGCEMIKSRLINRTTEVIPDDAV